MERYDSCKSLLFNILILMFNFLVFSQCEKLESNFVKSCVIDMVLSATLFDLSGNKLNVKFP